MGDREAEAIEAMRKNYTPGLEFYSSTRRAARVAVELAAKWRDEELAKITDPETVEAMRVAWFNEDEVNVSYAVRCARVADVRTAAAVAEIMAWLDSNAADAADRLRDSLEGKAP